MVLLVAHRRSSPARSVPTLAAHGTPRSRSASPRRVVAAGRGRRAVGHRDRASTTGTEKTNYRAFAAGRARGRAAGHRSSSVRSTARWRAPIRRTTSTGSGVAPPGAVHRGRRARRRRSRSPSGRRCVWVTGPRRRTVRPHDAGRSTTCRRCRSSRVTGPRRCAILPWFASTSAGRGRRPARPQRRRSHDPVARRARVALPEVAHDRPVTGRPVTSPVAESTAGRLRRHRDSGAATPDVPLAGQHGARHRRRRLHRRQPRPRSCAPPGTRTVAYDNLVTGRRRRRARRPGYDDDHRGRHPRRRRARRAAAARRRRDRAPRAHAPA